MFAASTWYYYMGNLLCTSQWRLSWLHYRHCAVIERSTIASHGTMDYTMLLIAKMCTYTKSIPNVLLSLVFDKTPSHYIFLNPISTRCSKIIVLKIHLLIIKLWIHSIILIFKCFCTKHYVNDISTFNNFRLIPVLSNKECMTKLKLNLGINFFLRYCESFKPPYVSLKSQNILLDFNDWYHCWCRHFLIKNN